MDGRRPRQAGPRNTPEVVDPCTDLGMSVHSNRPGSTSAGGREFSTRVVQAAPDGSSVEGCLRSDLGWRGQVVPLAQT